KATRSSGAVIVSWWCHPDSETETGTPSDWLSLLAGIVVEVHCICSPELAAERFLSRKRHEGHLDRFKTRPEVLSSFQHHAVLGPLGIGGLVEIDTEQPIDLENLIARIEKAFVSRSGK
ncbi:MAG TPA: hypothetical protein VHQ01_02855, partial [Pyrinomonadaceae bacterium]|nr:hypothetical protein [Pyrinomonadaceae bacterium]